MTDRLKGFIVTFDRDIREDDAEYLKNAIQMIKGVLSVEPVIANYEDAMNRARVRNEILHDIYEMVDKKTK